MIPDFKTYIGESTWDNIRKQSAGTRYRKEDNVDFMDMDEFIEYLNNRYVLNKKGEKFMVIGNTISVAIGYMRKDDVHPDYWNLKHAKDMWGVDSKISHMYLFYDLDAQDKSVSMTKLGKSMLTMQKKTAPIFDELDKRFKIIEDDNCIHFTPLNGRKITNSFFVEVLDAFTEVIVPPFIQIIYKKDDPRL